MDELDTFLPSHYKIPRGGNYFKLQDGENTFRVLASAIVGWEYWNEAGKPMRSKAPFTTTPDDIRRNDKGEPEKIKHFWAFPVWNYEANAVQVLEVTQKQIMDGMKALIDNAKWGDPKGYDFTITRSGTGFDTVYQVMPNPHSPTADEIKIAFEAKTINLEALYDGKDPFEAQ